MFPVASKVMLGVLFSAKTSCSLPLHAVSSMYRKLFSSHCCTALSMSWCEGSNCCVIKRPGSLDFSWFTLSTFSAKGKTFVSECSVRSTFRLRSCKHRAWLSKKSLLNFERSFGASPRAASKKATRGFSSCCPGWYWLQNAYFAKVSTPANSSASTSAVEKSIWWALCWNATLLSSAIRAGQSLALKKGDSLLYASMGCQVGYYFELSLYLSVSVFIPAVVPGLLMLSHEQKLNCLYFYPWVVDLTLPRLSLARWLCGWWGTGFFVSRYGMPLCTPFVTRTGLLRNSGNGLDFMKMHTAKKKLMLESIWSSWLKTNPYFFWVPGICTVWYPSCCQKKFGMIK